MKPSFQFDIATLLVAEMLMCLLFGLVLLVVASRFRQVRGVRQMAFAFLISFLGIFLLILRSRMPLVLNVVASNGLMFGTNLLIYSGIGGLLGFRPRFGLPVSVAIAALPALIYFTVVHNQIDTRILVIAVTECIMKWNLIVDLLRDRDRSRAVRLLTACLMLWAAANLLRGVATMFRGSPSNIFEYNLIQACFVAIGIFSSCGMGIFCMVFVSRQVTASLKRSALSDPLTGALNRRGIEELLTTEVERSLRSRTPLSLALIDIDHFKVFNDAGGHAAGDDVLRGIAAAVMKTLRPFDACGRLGGDEFLVLIPGASAPDAAIICSRILREVEAMPPHPTAGMAPTISIGFTETDAFDTIPDILDRADRALYAAKHRGRNCAQMELATLRAHKLSSL